MAENTGTLNAYSEVLQAVADGRIDQFGAILLALATVGVLAFAILEVIKAFPVREFFNRKVISGFITTRVRNWEDINEEDAKAELEKLAIGGDGSILYMLPIEKLAGQINAATQTALAYPAAYKTTIKVFASLKSNDEAVINDIDVVVAGAPEIVDSEELKPAYTAKLKNFTEARTRVSNLIQRNLDSLQISTTRRWTLLNQAAAIAISVILIFSLTEKPENLDRVSWFFMAAFAGMIAPVAKDILAKLKKPKV